MKPTRFTLKSLRTHCVLWIGIGMLWPALAQASPAYLLPEAPDVVFTTAIQEQVEALGSDPVRIFEFVRNEFKYQNYYGLMKGPEGTLFSRAGNEYDLSALLVSMLRHAGVPARFVRGKIRLTEEQATAWMGTDDVDAAWRYKIIRQPNSWIDDFDVLGTRVDPGDGGPDDLEVLHIWVEAEVPIARYRGAAGSSAQHGKAWVPLDPTFKASDWTVDPQLPFGTDPALTFDYTGLDGLYRSVSDDLPIDIFEDQLRKYLAANHVSGEQPRGVEDVMLRGTIRREEPGVLPTSLPYELSSVLPPVRAASLVNLHRHPSSGGDWWFAAAGTLGADHYRYKRSVHVCVEGTLNCENASSPAKLVDADGWSAEWEGRRVLLTFPPSNPGSLPPEGYEVSCPTSISAIPTITVEGEAPITGPSQNLCGNVQIVVLDKFPYQLGQFDRLRKESREGVGGTYLMAFDSQTANPARTAQAADALVAAQNAFPVVIPGGGGAAFVDSNRNGVLDPLTEKTLATHFEAQAALTGGLLHLAQNWWFEKNLRDTRRALAIHHQLPDYGPSVGFVTAGQTVSYLFDVPFAISPSGLLLDVLSLLNIHSRDFGGPIDAEHSASIAGHHGSALEHAVWEELSSLEAISTVKGFQLASEAFERPLLVIPTQISAEAATASCDHVRGCSAIDWTTYCEIKKSFGNSGVWRSAYLDGLCDTIYPDVTDELRISSLSEFTYRGWRGYVYYRKSHDPQAGTIGEVYSIRAAEEGEASGGYVPKDAESVDPLAPPPCASAGTCGSVPEYLEFPDPDWDWTLTAEDDLARAEAADPVSMLSGAYMESRVDLALAGPGGMALTLERSYNSRFEYDGPLGYGWIHTFDQHLRIDPRDPLVTGDERVIWMRGSAGQTAWNDTGVGQLEPKDSIFDKLVREPSGGFTLTTKNGMIYRFHVEVGDRANLASIEDRNGNIITTAHNGQELESVTLSSATGTSVHTLLFSYDELGHLESIREDRPGGREWRYTVNDDGDLSEYMDAVQVAKDIANPGSGLPWSYLYYSGLNNERLNHNLKCWIAPQTGRGNSPDVGPLCSDAGVNVGDDRVWMHFVYYSNDTVYKHTDSLGRATRFSINYLRKRSDATHPDGHTESHFFDKFGNVTRFVSPGGRVHTYEYDGPAHLPVLEHDAFGFASEAAYDEQGNLVRRKDRLGEEESWSFNEFAQPTWHTNRRGHRQHWQYDENGNLLRQFAEIDGQLELMQEFQYDAVGNPIEAVTYAAPEMGRPARTRFEYSDNGVGVVRSVDALGNVTRFKLDELGRPIETILTRTVATSAGSRRAESISTTTDYDELDRAIRTTDPLGVAVETDFDANGRAQQVRTLIPQSDGSDPIPRVDAVNLYDGFDRLLSVTDVLGHTAQFEYDERDRLVRTISPMGRETQQAYDGDGRVVTQIDGAGGISTQEYDAEGRPTVSTDALGRTSRLEYDEEGRVVESYGPDDRLLMRVHLFDENGNPVRVSDAKGNSAETVFDELGRTRSVTGPLNTPLVGTVSTEYDLAGRVLSRTDAEDHTIYVRYDDLGRPIETEDALGRKSFVRYDELGSPIETVDASGQRMFFQHDKRGLLLRRQGPGVDDRYAYDILGRRVSSRNSESTQLFEYDALDRLVSVRGSNSANALFGTARMTYDADGFLAQSVYPKVAAFLDAPAAVRYEYDARGLLSQMVDPVAGTWYYEYDALGREIRRIDPTGFERTTSFTPEGFVQRIEVHGPAGLVDFFHYSIHDNLGAPRFVTTTEGQTEVTYDVRNRVERIDYPNGEWERFEYDLANNRTLHVNRAGESRTYELDPADQLLAILETATQTELESFTYDRAGRRKTRNVAGSGTDTYGYDGLGRLTNFSRSGYSMDLHYDANGDRYRREESTGSTARYFGDWIEWTDQPRRLMRGPSGDVVGEVGLEAFGGSVRGLMTDGGRNVIHVTEDDDVVNTRRYEGFGEVRSESQPE